jgi:hypothetical protein
VVRTGKKRCKRYGGSEPICYTRRDEATEYEALKLAEMQARKKERTKPKGEKREKKPLTEKVKEMVGAR